MKQGERPPLKKLLLGSIQVSRQQKDEGGGPKKGTWMVPYDIQNLMDSKLKYWKVRNLQLKMLSSLFFEISSLKT